jgi:hypothetical protein
MSEDQQGAPADEVKAKLDSAAEIVTRHLDEALEECLQSGLDRDHFSAAVMASLMQAIETRLGSSTSEALEELARMSARKPQDG